MRAARYLGIPFDRFLRRPDRQYLTNLALASENAENLARSDPRGDAEPDLDE